VGLSSIVAVRLHEIVSMTATTNLLSQAVMRRLGMSRDPADDIDHPRVLDNNRLRQHVLFRLAAPVPGRVSSNTSAVGRPVEGEAGWGQATVVKAQFVVCRTGRVRATAA
jgi:hypothetical protein